MIKQYSLLEDVESALKQYQTDFKNNDLFDDMSKKKKNPFESVDVPSEQDKLRNLSKVPLPDFLLDDNVLVDTKDAGKVSNYTFN